MTYLLFAFGDGDAVFWEISAAECWSWQVIGGSPTHAVLVATNNYEIIGRADIVDGRPQWKFRLQEAMK